MPTRFIFQSQGNAVAFIDERNVYALDGQLVGFVDDREGVYDRNGYYKGVLLRDGRVALDANAQLPRCVDPPQALERVPRPNVIPHRRPLPNLPAPYVESFVVEPKGESEEGVAFPSFAIAVGLLNIGFIVSVGFYLARAGSVDLQALRSSPSAIATLLVGLIFFALALTSALKKRNRANLPRLLVFGEGREIGQVIERIDNAGNPIGVVAQTAERVDPDLAKTLIQRKQVDVALLSGTQSPQLQRGQFMTVSEFVESSTGRLSSSSLSLDAVEQLRRLSVGGGVRGVAKRAFDLVLAAALLLVVAPLMLVTALAVKLESAGPVFYRQTRVGINGKPFFAYRFRSLRANAEKNIVVRWATRFDPRVTRVGAFMRMTRIDELPQLFNVLRGDMSVVGPRPERPEFVKLLKEHIPEYELRHLVKPGITGWAQVRYSYGASLEDAVLKHEFDLYYVKNHTLLMDLQILVETVAVVMFREAAT